MHKIHTNNVSRYLKNILDSTKVDILRPNGYLFDDEPTKI